jgi:hypothetical protein
MKFALTYGNLNRGFTLIGPFDDPLEALTYAENQNLDFDWSISRICEPGIGDLDNENQEE